MYRTAYRSQWPRGLRRGSATSRLQSVCSNPTVGHGCLSVVNVVCCQVELSASVRSLVQRSPTDCGVSECDLETSRMKRL